MYVGARARILAEEVLFETDSPRLLPSDGLKVPERCRMDERLETAIDEEA